MAKKLSKLEFRWIFAFCCLLGFGANPDQVRGAVGAGGAKPKVFDLTQSLLPENIIKPSIRHQFKHNGGIEKIAHSPDGQKIFVFGEDQGFSMYDLVTGEESRFKLPMEYLTPTSVLIDPKNRFVAFDVNENGPVYVVDLESKKFHLVRASWAKKIYFSPDFEKLLVVETEPSKATILFLSSGKRVVYENSGFKMRFFEFSKDSKNLTFYNPGYGKSSIENRIEVLKLD
jgi:WD40 repeat protein